MKTFRAEGIAYALFTLFVGVPAAALGFSGRAPGAALLLGSAYGAILVWLHAFEIVLASDHLEFRSLFGGRRRIAYGDIEVVRLAHEPGRAFAGPFRLRVVPKATLGQESFSVNAKVFSREAIVAVLETSARVARADDGELLDGLAMKTLRKWTRRQSR